MKMFTNFDFFHSRVDRGSRFSTFLLTVCSKNCHCFGQFQLDFNKMWYTHRKKWATNHILKKKFKFILTIQFCNFLNILKYNQFFKKSNVNILSHCFGTVITRHIRIHKKSMNLFKITLLLLITWFHYYWERRLCMGCGYTALLNI